MSEQVKDDEQALKALKKGISLAGCLCVACWKQGLCA